MKTSLPLVALLFGGCSALVGSGNVTTSTREVAAFRRVAVHSGIQAAITTGARSVTVRADDNLQDAVEARVEGDTLVVRLKPGLVIPGLRVLEADITNDFIEGLDASGGAIVTSTLTPVDALRISASGGSEVHAGPVSSTSVTVEASGGSRVSLTGSASTAVVAASGGSEVSLRELPLEALELAVSGGSSLTARVASSLSGSASGGSTVTILGTPSSSVELSGGSHLATGAK